MRDGARIIAVVPARSGSKGIPDKNLQEIRGESLLGRAGRVLADPSLAFLDLRFLSTDSPRYAEEGRRNGLECPFLRPAELAQDGTSALDTMRQVWTATEAHYRQRFDVLLIVEPTCPLRTADDVERTVDRLLRTGADSAVTVSRVDSKFNPYKLLELHGESRLKFFLPEAAHVTVRQTLPQYYYRNGACYALTKRALFERGVIFTENTEAVVIDRPLVNIDEPLDLRLARWLAEGEMP